MSYAYIKIEIPEGWNQDRVMDFIREFNRTHRVVCARFVLEED